ncbi:MAG: DUF4202 domain-containing protein [Hyphomicrobiaceae bacterium]|nr:DUF4202 domain-containing protein [Hyphomicrobiaceae bacterium]
MSSPAPRFDQAIAAIDAANAEDPVSITVDGERRPAEQLYGERMSEELAKLHPDASEALRLASRAQHIRRWTVPRASYPMDRTGYLRWRTDLKRKHSEMAADIMLASGYADDEIARVGALIRKERLKHDAEAQALEDVACIVFLKHYIDEFAAKHDDAKLISILRKTWVKMSPHGHAAALKLSLSPRVGDLVGRALQADPA